MNDEMIELKRELIREFNREMDTIRRKQLAFMRRISTIANLLMPGMGFIIFGKSYLKGTIFFFPLFFTMFFIFISCHPI